MSNEEAIEVLRTIEVCSFKDKSKKYFFKDVTDALDMAIKALEQEFVLDKIRAEIIGLRSGQNVGVLECLDIIDKYKTGSEE